MKTKLVLGLAMASIALATAHSAKAAFSMDISIGSHFPRSAPVVVAPPPVVYSPAPVDNCQPVVSYPPRYSDYDHRYAYRHDDWRNHRVIYRRDEGYGGRGRW